MKIVIGPKSGKDFTYIAYDQSGYTAFWLPDHIMTVVESNLQPGLGGPNRDLKCFKPERIPQSFSLGVDGTFCYIPTTGEPKFKFRAPLQFLENYLKEDALTKGLVRAEALNLLGGSD